MVATYRRAKDLMEAEIGAELVALDAEGGSCFGFNEVATSVWRSLEQPRTFDELRDELTASYEVSTEQCSSELQELIADLLRKGLITCA